MIYYITSPTYKEVISSVINENELLLSGCDEGEDILLCSFVKQNCSTKLSAIDTFVIDLSACCDVDERIIEALEILRMTNDNIKIVVLAALRHPGDALLTQCFQMAIYDIICTDDFLEIRNELNYCLQHGKQYKDALEFKVANKDQYVVKTEVKKTVNKVMIGMAGTQIRVGVTHNAIVLANYLRKRGYMVAIAEYNTHDSLGKIAENSDNITVKEDGSFTLNGVDYYPCVDESKLASILGKSYNFVISDFGSYKNCNQMAFNMSAVRIIVAGAKAWELDYLNDVFSIVGLSQEETLKGYHYCFNLCPDNMKKNIVSAMASLQNVHFLNLTMDPIMANEFADAEEILKEYLPDKVEEPTKKGFSLPFGKGKK